MGDRPLMGVPTSSVNLARPHFLVPMKAFNLSQPLANQVLNHLVAAVESDDETESSTDIAA